MCFTNESCRKAYPSQSSEDSTLPSGRCCPVRLPPPHTHRVTMSHCLRLRSILTGETVIGHVWSWKALAKSASWSFCLHSDFTPQPMGAGRYNGTSMSLLCTQYIPSPEDRLVSTSTLNSSLENGPFPPLLSDWHNIFLAYKNTFHKQSDTVSRKNCIGRNRRRDKIHSQLHMQK